MKRFPSAAFTVYLGLAKVRIEKGERECLCRLYALCAHPTREDGLALAPPARSLLRMTTVTAKLTRN